MQSDNPAIDPEALLEHLDWVRELAERLVGDPSLADDLSQETWLAALRSPPPRRGAVRSWLGTVVRNLARQVGRSEARRRELEEDVAETEAIPGAVELVEKVSIQRHVVGVLLGLREPFRGTLLLRYYEQRTPLDIARTSGVPVATVKSRLRRGLADLRTRLDSEYGGESRAVLLALLPRERQLQLARAGVAAGSLPAGLMLGFAAVGLAALVLGIRWFQDSGGPAEVTPSSGVAAVSSEGIREGGDATDGRERVTIEPAPAEDGSETPAKAAEVPLLSGAVIDLDGNAVPGVDVRFHADDRRHDLSCRATSGADGRFEIHHHGVQGRVRPDDAAGSGHVQVMEAYVFPDHGDTELVVVVANPCPLAGRVVDADGIGVADAKVSFLFQSDFRLTLDRVVDQSASNRWVTYTAPDGTWSIANAPCTPLGMLRAAKAGFHVLREPLDGRVGLDLELALTAVADAASVLQGEVVDALGAPIEDAWVAVGDSTGMSVERGRFQIDLDGLEAETRLAVVKPGLLPAFVDLPADGDERYAFRRIELTGEPVSLSGIVVDATGEPVVDAEVLPIDPTHFGRASIKSSGATIRAPVSVEQLLGGRVEIRGVRTDAEGWFEIDGVLDRSYRLLVMDRRTLRRTISPSLAAGSVPHTIVLEEDVAVTRVTGTIVGVDGEPVAGAYIKASRAPLAEERRTSAGPRSWGDEIACGSDGRFEFEALAREGLMLSVRGATERFPATVLAPPALAGNELLVPLYKRCHLRVSLGDRPGLADAFVLLDEHGHQTPLLESKGELLTYLQNGDFPDGKNSLVLTAPECARTLVLSKGGGEVLRMPLSLTPGEITQIEL